MRIKKVGANRAGVYHNARGIDVSDHEAKVEELVHRLSPDVSSIAVGDGGNEVGMGVVGVL